MRKRGRTRTLDLDLGRHYFDELLTIRVTGTVERQADQLVAPTTSISLVPTLALFWEKCGVTRDRALAILREAITEAMADGVSKNERIEARMKDVDAAIKAIKDDLVAKLPKARRSGKVVTKDLQVEITSAFEALVPAA